MKRFLIPIAIAAVVCSCGRKAERHHVETYLDPSADLEERVEDALSRLTTEEKVAMVHAQSKFSSPGVPRLGIPEVWCTDGPHGIRPEVLWDEWDQAGWTNDSCTAYPALTCLAASWDRELAALYGRYIGEEARYRKKDVLLGPGVNICRTPLNGRNFEYMGEDPFLAGAMVVPYVRGVQENGVAACVKHYALNNQEHKRHDTNVTIDDRTLYEIYLPAFKAAVEKGGAWAIMGSYNLYDGQHCCHNKKLLVDILKEEWGFDGVVISDWGGVHDDDEPIVNGLDMEYGTGTNGLYGAAENGYDYYHLAKPYLERIRDGRAGTTELDDKVRRILRLIFRTSMAPERHYGRFTCPEHFEAARKIAAEGTVLLKNDGVLPFSNPGKILVVGENAIKKLVVGGGSSSLKTRHEITPLEALQEEFGGAVSYERGYVGDIEGSYNNVSTGQDLSEERSPSELIEAAVAAAADADLVIFVGGLNKSKHQDREGSDRLELPLPYGQQDVIEALAGTGKKLVVINISGSPVAMPWADKANAIIQGWYGGSENGRALADVLTGRVNPSGKLPFTIPCSLEDGPLKSEKQYPGVKDENGVFQEEYSEGVFVGYRWYATEGIAPQFPFGYGLSYTSFEISGLKATRSRVGRLGEFKVKLTLTNTGDRDGAEVVQVYVAPPASPVARPARELKGFEKVYLKAGESRQISIELSYQDLCYFDADAHKWTAAPGEYTILVGTSSADLPASTTIKAV